jgi:hypothetical protein
MVQRTIKKVIIMTQQTAVEWLIEQLRSLSHSLEAHLGTGDIRVTQGMIDELEEKALQMEKKQSIAELRYKDGTLMRKYNSPKLQAIEMEISDEEIKKEASKLYGVGYLYFLEGAKWYREQLKNIDKKL